MVEDVRRRQHDWQVGVGTHDDANDGLLVRKPSLGIQRCVQVELFGFVTTQETCEETPQTIAELCVGVRNDGDVTHLAAFAAFGITVQVDTGTRYCKRKLGERRYLGYIGRCAENVGHAGGGHLQSSGAQWEGENGAQVVLVLRCLACFDCIVT